MPRQELRAVFVERKQKGIHLDDAEIDSAIERIFAKHDADANSSLSFKEFAAAWNDLCDEIVKLNKLAIGRIVEQSNFRCVGGVLLCIHPEARYPPYRPSREVAALHAQGHAQAVGLAGRARRGDRGAVRQARLAHPAERGASSETGRLVRE